MADLEGGSGKVAASIQNGWSALGGWGRWLAAVEEKGAAIWLGGAESKVEALGWIWIGRIPRAKGVGRVAAGGMGWMGQIP